MKDGLAAGDALLLVDVQNDFLPGGSLPVPNGNEVVPVLNRYLALFHAHDLPIFATRDWHPPDHCSFLQKGGPWPPHCIAETPGAAFPTGLELPTHAHIISKATLRENDAYSGFDDTRLDTLLRSFGIRRLFIGGLATEYCVLNTVKDALRHRYSTFVLEDAVRAISVADGVNALEEMRRLGAIPIHYEVLLHESDFQPPAD
ncbi:nicotinamidase [Nitrosovibrio tenuis]|uniref:nicotinamidase n=1 Tax=Nitrosovibrio tenuis TaxID=1233 RepID=A0A1H7JUZ4_9PROT|nr:nicotinamidase [Nitrosovibrio tenuis]SEK78194.1 nicotinamidase/pyrazinamidase [Nitrosovibrio tenuis]